MSKPYIWECTFDDESKYVDLPMLADRYASLGWRVTPLYDRPNDNLIYAAKRLMQVLDDHDPSSLEFLAAVSRLRFVLESEQ